jgi:hypothetical protein
MLLQCKGLGNKLRLHLVSYNGVKLINLSNINIS